MSPAEAEARRLADALYAQVQWRLSQHAGWVVYLATWGGVVIERIPEPAATPEAAWEAAATLIRTRVTTRLATLDAERARLVAALGDSA